MNRYNCSIIIPHFNIPDLLVRCLRTIPEFDDLQVIVVDDNSPNSNVYLGKYPELKRKNVEFIRTARGGGAGYARNVGLEYAKGSWILFADSDDFFFNDFYKTISAYFDSKYDVILFKANSVDSETLEPTKRDENINLRIDQALSGCYDIKEIVLKVHSPWCRLIRNKFINDNHIRFDEVMASNDTMFTTKVTCLANKIGFCEKPIYIVTRRTGSLWDSRKSNPQNYLSRLKVQIRRNNYVKGYGYDQVFILKYVLASKRISLTLFIRALFVAVCHGGIFQGLDVYLNNKLRRTK